MDGDLAGALLAARSGRLLGSDTALHDAAHAYKVQALVMAELGEIGGWKVGAPGPGGPISCAPMPAAGLFEAPATLDPEVFRQREVESEICFRLAADLPPCADGYTRADVIAAIATCHPGIEVLQSRFTDPDTASPLALLADFIQTGAFVTGAPIADWQALDFTTLSVTQTIGEAAPKRATGNPAGDMIRLVTWLANEGALWAGGLRAGQVITCGSWTGKTRAPAGSLVTTAFHGALPVTLRFA